MRTKVIEMHLQQINVYISSLRVIMKTLQIIKSPKLSIIYTSNDI